MTAPTMDQMARATDVLALYFCDHVAVGWLPNGDRDGTMDGTGYFARAALGRLDAAVQALCEQAQAEAEDERRRILAEHDTLLATLAAQLHPVIQSMGVDTWKELFPLLNRAAYEHYADGQDGPAFESWLAGLGSEQSS